jgi:PleD family two-component response regulator
VESVKVIEADTSILIGRAKVLIVDDEYHTRKTIRALLLAMGCTRIHEAGDGVGGLDAIRAFSPDVSTGICRAWTERSS